jgi:hypothetical protein
VAAVSAKVDKENTTIVTTPARRPTSRLAQIKAPARVPDRHRSIRFDPGVTRLHRFHNQ